MVTQVATASGDIGIHARKPVVQTTPVTTEVTAETVATATATATATAAKELEVDPRQNGDDIDRLNWKVDQMIAEGKLSGPEIDYAKKNQVYHRRSKLAIYAAGIVEIIAFTQSPSLAEFSVWALLMYFYLDFYSGVLHVVLDNPKNIGVPLIDLGVLEFQWHHHLPRDIVSKSIFEVIGDMNLPVAAHLIIVLGLWRGAVGMDLDWNVSCMILGLKLFFAWMNQYSHRMSHAKVAERPKWVIFLQNNGIMLHPTTHHKHHKTYDDAFPTLSGHTQGAITFLIKHVKNDTVWLVSFFLLTLTDVMLMIHAHQYVMAKFF